RVHRKAARKAKGDAPVIGPAAHVDQLIALLGRGHRHERHVGGADRLEEAAEEERTPRKGGARFRRHPSDLRDPEVGEGARIVEVDVEQHQASPPRRPSMAARTKPRRSWPQMSSGSRSARCTTKVGTPKAPASAASSTAARSASFVSCVWALATTAAPSKPAASRASVTTPSSAT